jgi:putative ABC transport system permease protein
MERLLMNFKMGLEALATNRFRAFLTSLGIIFGVAAVIAMLAIGAGAEREILEQIRLVGSNNLIIKALPPDPAKKQEEKDNKDKPKFSPGLNLKDAENILATVEHAGAISPEIEIKTPFMRDGIRQPGRLIGVSNAYFQMAGVNVGEGKYFSPKQLDNADAVCIIGRQIKATYFSKINPIGQFIKCGNVWLQVVGVLEGGLLSDKNIEKLSIRNYNSDIYTPIKTVLLRYTNRGLTTPSSMKRRPWEDNDDKKKNTENYHQIDRLVVNIKESEHMESSVDLISKILNRRHNGVEDVEIVVPELLLKQEQKTKKLFNIVLGVIASISLLVGGIGIMNIMLASVMERVKEIGLRLAIGAQKKDIVWQFIAEAVAISFSGGLAGIVLGIVICFSVEKLAGIQTFITGFSVVLSFGVAITVGLVFGIFPARKAAGANPIESLRYE